MFFTQHLQGKKQQRRASSHTGRIAGPDFTHGQAHHSNTLAKVRKI